MEDGSENHLFTTPPYLKNAEDPLEFADR